MRDINSPLAHDLINQGAELISLPLNIGHKAEYTEAFRGSKGVFLITPNIAPPQTHETELGIMLADAAVAAEVKHLVFSSLENVNDLTNGEEFAPHFTDKARIEDYIRTLPITSSFIYMAFFYTNFLEFYTPRVEEETLVFPIYLPKDFRAPFVDPLTATGPAVLEILSNPKEYAGKSLPVIGDIISPQEMVDTFARVTGKKVAYSSAYSKADFLHHFPEMKDNDTLVHEILGMAKYAVEYGYYGDDKDLLWSRKINPATLDWEQFLIHTGWQGEKISY